MFEGPDRGWIAGLPKAEVHLHLEGCVPPSPDAPVGVISSLAQLLAHLDRACGAVETHEQLGAIAKGIVERAVASGAGHLDVIVNPLHWPHWSHRLSEMFDALDAVFEEAESEGGPTVGLCPSLSRTYGATEADEFVDDVLSIAHRRVVGLSIDGNESGGSHNERFAAGFERAAAAGLRRCAHAGESSGAEGVREAVEMLGAERIDHGVRCLEDPTVVEELVELRVPLDVCPTSNVVLGLVGDIAQHPLEPLRAAGVRVSVNTDDPLLYGIDLLDEYERCATTFGWGRRELAAVARTSIESCFAPAGRRAELLAELDRYVAG
ncbi:MAG: adenosine deaminase family protein [Acidimicrobiales bacterium]